MTSVAAVCHACNGTFLASSQTDPESLRCRSCGSEFVEFLEPAATQSPRPMNAPRRSPFPDRLRGYTPQEREFSVFPETSVSVRVTPGRADDFVRELTLALGMETYHGRGSRSGSFRRNFGSEEMERLVGQLAQQYQTRGSPASAAAVRGLRREKLKSGRRALMGECCVVCHEHYKDGDNVVHLPCQHVFHEDCVLPWFDEHNTCPVCRFALPVESPSAMPPRLQQRSRANHQVAPASPPHRDVTGDHDYSFLDMFRPATGGDNLHPRPRNRSFSSHYDMASQETVAEGEGERRLRESVRRAQNQLSSLEERLTEHVAEHRRLQNQILQLQDHRQSLRTQASAVQYRGMEAVGRMENMAHQHQRRAPTHASPSSPVSRWLFGMMRNGTSNQGGSHDFDNTANFSDASRYGG